MERAIYFPYATITDHVVLKQALLLWDKLEYIVPWEGFPPQTDERDLLDAIGVVGESVIPDNRVKERTHARIKSLLKGSLEDGGRGLPKKYLLDPGDEAFHIYGDKLNAETWQMLTEEYALIDGALRKRGNHPVTWDYRLSRSLALAIMTILTEEIAGNTAQKVTDQKFASEEQAALKTRELGGDLGTFAPGHEMCLVQMLAPAVPVAGIPLSELVRIRKSETAFLKDLRENYRDSVDEYIMSVTAPDSSRDDIRRIVGAYENRMKGHLTELTRMLRRQEQIQWLGIGEILGVGVGSAAVTAVAVSLVSSVAPLTALAVALASGTAIAGIHKAFRLAGSIPQNQEKREKLLNDNPAAWLYYMEKQTGVTTFRR